MKKIVTLLLVVVMACTSLCACGNDGLSGKYVCTNSFEDCAVEFKGNGKCIWYEDDMFFNGTYEKTEDGWRLNISGSGFYANTVFTAVEHEEGLYIEGGDIEGGLFKKQ